MKKTILVKAILAGTLLLSQMTWADTQSHSQNQKTNQFISRAVKFNVKTQDGKAIPEVKIVAFKSFSVFSLGLFTSGHFVPQFDPHTEESRYEETVLGQTNEMGELEIDSYTWDKTTLSKNYLNLKNLKVSYGAQSSSEISIYGCYVGAKDLDRSVNNEPVIVNCLAYENNK